MFIDAPWMSLLFLFCMYAHVRNVYGYVLVEVYMCVWAHVCVCMQRPEFKIRYLSLSLFTLFIETESLTELGDH